MADAWMIHVDLDHACFGLVVDERQVVVDHAPIARYTLGWRAGRATRYFRGRGATVVVSTLKSQADS